MAPPWARNQPENPFNRENNREFFEFDHKIIEFCPKSANFLQEQGINREFCGYPAKLLSTNQLIVIFVGFKKLTGNYQGIMRNCSALK
jgi:hypothetical protein